MAKKVKAAVTKQYKLRRDIAPLCFMLNSNHNKRSPLLYFDEEQGINRPLRYARNQKSPFEDEQDGNAILEPVVFEDGFLMVDRTNQVLQEFLSYHPGNGMIFEEIDDAKDAAEELEIEELILDAQLLARDLSIEKLETDIEDGNDFLVSIETQEKMLKSEKIDLAVWNFILGLVEKNDKLQN